MSLSGKIYILLLHVSLIVLIVKTDAIRKTGVRLGFLEEKKPELSRHYSNMVAYYRSVDANTPANSILFFGDSSIQHLSVAAIDSSGINFGIGEETTLGLLQRLPEYQSLKFAKLVVISIGYNDFKYRPNPEILDNIEKIAKLIPESIPALFSSVFPVDERARPDLIGLNAARIGPLNRSLEQFCARHERFSLLKPPSSMIDSEGNLLPQLHLGDGIHRNPRGNALLIEEMKSAISELSNR